MKTKFYNFILFIIILIMISFSPEYVHAQNLNATTIKIGYFNPKDASSGLLFGLNHSYVIDEAIDVGFGADLFYKSYQRDTEVAKTQQTGDVTETTKQKDLEFSSLIVPLMATANIKIPFSPYSPAFFMVNGGIGWEMMFNNEQNYATGEKQSRFYHGFGYMVNLGVMYQIGSRSALCVELGYNGSKVSRNHKVEEGLPVWDEVNISGLIFRAGIRLGVL